MTAARDDVEQVRAATAAWLDDAVIGLGLCPFASAARAHDRIRIAVTAAADWAAVRDALVEELERIAAADPAGLETTLLVCPDAPADFDEFNDFLDVADDAVRALDLEGFVQIASFHPRYRFAGTAADDIGNATNRAPFATLHLLREESVERAVDSFGDTEAIVDANMRTLAELGPAGWERLSARWTTGREPG